MAVLDRPWSVSVTGGRSEAVGRAYLVEMDQYVVRRGRPYRLGIDRPGVPDGPGLAYHIQPIPRDGSACLSTAGTSSVRP